MSNKKYIIIEDRSAIVFADPLKHSEVAGKHIVTSAGFVNIQWDSEEYRFICKCYGESVSLDIKSNAETDNIILERMMNGSY